MGKSRQSNETGRLPSRRQSLKQHLGEGEGCYAITARRPESSDFSFALRGGAQDARITIRAGRRLLIGTGSPAIDATT
jgi:hypothetical protein